MADFSVFLSYITLYKLFFLDWSDIYEKNYILLRESLLKNYLELLLEKLPTLAASNNILLHELENILARRLRANLFCRIFAVRDIRELSIKNQEKIISFAFNFLRDSSSSKNIYDIIHVWNKSFDKMHSGVGQF